jgi:hypothetical protein
MNIYKNARFIYLRSLEMVQAITERGLCASQRGLLHGVSAVTVRNLAAGAAGLCDRSLRAIAPATALAIVELRRQLFLQARISSCMGFSRATVSQVLRRAGFSMLSNLQPKAPVQHYEREAPGKLNRPGFDGGSNS